MICYNIAYKQQKDRPVTTATTTNKKESDKFKDLIGPMDTKLDKVVREMLITARVGLLLKASFFGNLATRLRLVNADEWCATAATDGRNFYYNTRFIKMLKPKEIEFLFGHEVLHCVYDHFGRRGSRDPQLWNIANDFAVNGDLDKHKVGDMITSVPCLFDRKYDGLSSEEIYDQLYEKADKINLSDLLDKMIDEHMDGDNDGDGSGDEKDGKGRPKLSPEERQAIKDEIKEAMLAAAATVDGAGNIPAGVKRLIQDMTEPKMNWRELLRMQLESTIKSDYTWMRASRKGWHMDAVMPGMKLDPMIDIAVALDASGSISEKMLKDFLGEIQGIMDSFPAYRIQVALPNHQVVHIVNDGLSVQTVHLGLLIQEEVPQIEVQREVPPRVIDVLLIELIQDLHYVGLTVRIECRQVQLPPGLLD
jgi:predicted metal-dependent peptidase